MSPDELAETVKSLVQENGGCLASLKFETRAGMHSYETLHHRTVGDPLPFAVLVPAD